MKYTRYSRYLVSSLLGSQITLFGLSNRDFSSRVFLGVSLVLGSLFLSACGEPEREIEQWMKAESKDMRGQVASLEEPKPFIPFKYEVDKQTDPFNTIKVTKITDAKSTQAGGVGPDLSRPKQPLEAFPLESLRMVGVIEQRKAFYGIIMADNKPYRIAVGGYMGQNYGQVTSISEFEISLKELVQDGSGDWVERISSLQLQIQER